MLSEISQRQKEKYFKISLICGISRSEIAEAQSTEVLAWRDKGM